MVMSRKIRVVVIDNQEGVRAALKSNGRIEIVAEGAIETDVHHLTEKTAFVIVDRFGRKNPLTRITGC